MSRVVSSLGASPTSILKMVGLASGSTPPYGLMGTGVVVGWIVGLIILFRRE